MLSRIRVQAHSPIMTTRSAAAANSDHVLSSDHSATIAVIATTRSAPLKNADPVGELLDVEMGGAFRMLLWLSKKRAACTKRAACSKLYLPYVSLSLALFPSLSLCTYLCISVSLSHTTQLFTPAPNHSKPWTLKWSKYHDDSLVVIA